jgi:hypothetical protein
MIVKTISLAAVLRWFGTGPVTLGRTLSLGLGQSHCGKNTRFGTGTVTLWEEYFVWDWSSYTQFGTGPFTFWEEH